MTVATQFRTAQAQVFRLGHLINVLQMSAAELEDHLAEAAEHNPLIEIQPRRVASVGIGGTSDILEMTAEDSACSLYGHVMRELAGPISRGGDLSRMIIALIEDLEPTGWLGSPLSAVASELGVSEDSLDSVLSFVQRQVDPAGLFARDLRDCLRLQLLDRGSYSGAMVDVLERLDVLEQGGAGALAAATGMPRAQVDACLATICRLDPKPGARFHGDPTLMREPDVKVEASAEGWSIRLMSACDSHVEVTEMPPGRHSPDIRTALAQARSLKRAIDLRRSALMEVMRIMVAWQGDFFRDGPEALKPLTMTQLARATGFHVSTVSRVLNGLLIEGPARMTLARDLCARRCAVASQSAPAKPQVVSRIRQILRAEDPERPHSDQRISELLAAEGVPVSRRVVAKYRRETGISPASARRASA